MDVNKGKVLSNYVWRLLEIVGSKGVGLIVSIILARILVPSDYGEIAIINVFLNLLSIFIEYGMVQALIQKKDADDLDFDSVFYFNLFCCVFLYLVMFSVAPLISAFYEIEHLTLVIRVESLLLIISGVKSIQKAYVSKCLMFRRFFFATLGGTIGAAGIGIWMAYSGFGVWALVVQMLFNNAVDTSILWITVKWRPRLRFSMKRVRTLLSFGVNLMIGELIDKSYWDFRQVVIGKVFTTSELAYFNRGGQLPMMISTTLSTGLGDILFPAMSAIQDDVERVRFWIKRVIQIHSYLFYPIMFGMAAVARPLVIVLFTDKWIEIVPYLQLFCMLYIFDGIGTANTNAIKAMGYSNLIFRLNLIRTPMHIVGMIVAIPFGIYAVAVSAVVTTLLGALMSVMLSTRIVNYPLGQQIKVVLPHLLLSMVMALCVYPISYIGINSIYILVIQVCTGALLYLFASLVFKVEIFFYLKNTAKEIIGR